MSVLAIRADTPCTYKLGCCHDSADSFPAHANGSEVAAAKVKPGDLQGISSAVEPGVLIVFRGSIDNMANSERDKDTQLVPTGIDAVRVHKGYRETYERVASQVDMYLNELGCRGGNCTIYATGHGSGAAIAQIALMRLSAQGFRIGTSYLFSSPMVGDAGFASYMERMFQPGQGGPVFEVVEGKEPRGGVERPVMAERMK